MALDSFIGKWQEEKKEGFDELVSAIGLSEDKKMWYREKKTEIEYKKAGDGWEIIVGFVGGPNSRSFFSLGEPYDCISIDGSPMKSVVRAEGEKLVEKHTGESLLGAEMDIVRWIEGQNMIVKTACKGVTMTSVFNKI